MEQDPLPVEMPELSVNSGKVKVERLILDNGRDFFSRAIIQSTGELQTENKYIVHQSLGRNSSGKLRFTRGEVLFTLLIKYPARYFWSKTEIAHILS